MPFAPGQAVYGYPRDGDGSVARAASAFHAVKAGGTTYTAATQVWQYCNGAWRLAWASTVVPVTSVIAVYQPADTSVLVTWTLPVNGNALTYTVRRFDGTIAGTVAYTVTQFKDDSPIPGTGTYTVTADNGPDSTVATSNSITINPQPATVTATYLATYQANVSWTPNVQGRPDQWRVWDVTYGQWVTPLIAGSANSAIATGLTPGSITQLAVYPFISGVQGAGRNAAATVSVPAAAVTNAVMFVTGNRWLTLQYTQAVGVVTGYSVDVYDLGGPNANVWVHYADNPPQYVQAQWTTGSGQGYMRIATLAPGGISPYVQVGPIMDTTGPHVTTPTVTNVDGIGWVISTNSWRDDQSSEYPYVALQVSFNGGAWTTWRGWDAQANSDYGYTVPDANRGMLMSHRSIAQDVWGNQTISAASPQVQTKPKGTFYVLATGVDSYTFGSVNAWRGFWQPYSDGQPTYGAWFYGAGWYNACKGYQPDTATILMIKDSANAGESGTHDLQLMTNMNYDQAVPPAGAGGVFTGPNLTIAGQAVEWGLPDWMRASMAIGSSRGMLLVPSGGPRRLYGTNLNGNSGRITFYFN